MLKLFAKKNHVVCWSVSPKSGFADTYCLYGSSKARNRTLLCSSFRSRSCCSSDWSKLETGDADANHMTDEAAPTWAHGTRSKTKPDLMKMRASSLGYSM